MSADDAAAVLSFELANRAYFAASISDRGDAYFEAFADRHHAALAEQDRGISAFYLLLDRPGAVLGRFNLYDVDDETADLGYRVAQHAAGRGVATAAVLELCRLAPPAHGLRILRAATAHTNPASQRVLIKSGFVPLGATDPAALGGQPGTWYRRELGQP